MTNVVRRKLGEEISIEQVVVAQALGCWLGEDWAVVYPGKARRDYGGYSLWVPFSGFRYSEADLEHLQKRYGAKFYLLSPAVEEVLDED